MHWVSFFILLYLAAVVQSTVAPAAAIHHARPDFMVILAVFYALMAPGQDAVLACWIVGLMMDLMSLGYEGRANVGLHAASLGAAGWLIVRVRSLTLRESVGTQLFFTFSATAAVSMLAGAYMMYAARAWNLWAQVVGQSLFTAAYTAMLAPYLHWMLRRLRGPLGMPSGSGHRTL